MEDLEKKLNKLFSRDENSVLELLDNDLDNLNHINSDERYINVIIQLLLNTKNDKIRNKCAIILYELNNPKALQPLMEVIKRKETSGKRSTLIWGCSRFDCTPYLSFFVNLAIKESYEAVLMGVIPVINNMKGYFYYKDLEISFLELISARKNNKITTDKELLVKDIESFLVKMIDNPDRIEQISKLIEAP